ncbi:hypothetical protein, partial [Klebsiella pneumoniae]|uniref:hypothetical protein n=1 Tax=Klebsiella pneumoniae TaxID=573 RepID=UPI0025A13467
KSKYFPTIADAIAACFKVRDHALARNNKASAVDALPVYQKDKKAKEMVADYVKSYRATPLFLEASREGWDLALLRYVQAVASTQAQMIQT